MSAVIAPRSKVKAQRKPFVILVSMRIKKMGPMAKAKRNPYNIA
jgi:ribosomal protein L30/L7E